jgi:tryptophan synthase alpha chain
MNNKKCMSRLKELFNRKNKSVLNVYFTAGYPELTDTLPVMSALQEAGADLIELGMPYSDPLADGPVIQESSAIALQNGMSISTLFSQLESMRNTIKLPVVLMGYMNPVLQYGFEDFCKKAAAVGVDGLILPDLPPYEFETKYRAVLAENGLDFIFLVTPETTEERVRYLDSLSSGFLYAVSSSSTTGKEKDFKVVQDYLIRLGSYKLGNPVLVGFGIKDRETFQAVVPYANGAIIGSAFISALSKGNNPLIDTAEFIASVLNENP